VQVLADNAGRVVHLFERECSVQRRHQKVLEETPSPSITPAVRARICGAGVKAAAAAGYRNAGTVEFLVDVASGAGDETPFYFLEMNTRLQVEHPVTELVTGLDLVHAQLRVASGEALPWPQEAVTTRGHAVEARVYAEDPDAGFLPQAGRLLLYREPRIPGVRVDSGVSEGDEVPVHYDPLLAKVVASAETRALAISRLAGALRSFPVLGIKTNIPFLIRVLDDPRFARAEMHTAFLDTEGAALAEPALLPMPPVVMAAIAAHAASGSRGAARSTDLAPADPWLVLQGWRG
jgi:acetyl/propionyl-CoA carboxylase alpha subunit